ncbi:MAG TPA: penicillin-binding protein 2 [Tepidisphaeraceae bacterium]|jgi:cell division protein FtsI/penicillin-binding protein 2
MLIFSSRRAAGVMIVVGILFLALMGRVAYLQTYGRQQSGRSADRQQHLTDILLSRRGGIFDSTGCLMAGTVQSSTLFIDPKFMQESFQSEGHSLVEMDDAIAKISKLLDKDSFEISQLLSDRSESRYLKIAENVDDDVVKAIEKMSLPGIGFTPTNRRFYPMGSIGAHLLGGTGADGHGLEGLELQFDKMLAGKDGRKETLKDARRRPIATAAEDYIPAQHGQHLVLTIDSNIQMIAEQELAASCQHVHAKRGEVIVMDPQTGNVLALANWPTFNPQNLDDSLPETRRDRCLTDPYEPGSTIKPFIAGPALAWNITRPNEIWPIHGPHYTTPYGRHVTDVHGYDSLAMWDVLVKSSNIGMSMLGERMGNARLYQAVTSFGFGRRTGIEMPGEDPGRVNPLRKWTKYSTESVSQGYEIMVTPLQLARAFCTYANGGRLVTPHLLNGTLESDGGVASREGSRELKLMPQVLDAYTAAQMKRILCDVVIRGTAIGARSRLWNIAGKTGTAYISEGRGGYSESKFTSSFIGMAPAESPRLVVAFIVHEPDRKIAHYGGTVAAPGASKLLERSLTYLQVPESPDLPVPPPQIANVLYNYDAKQYQKPKEKKTAEREAVVTAAE